LAPECRKLAHAPASKHEPTRFAPRASTSPSASQIVEQISENYKKSHAGHFNGPRALPEEERNKKLEATETGIVKFEAVYRKLLADVSAVRFEPTPRRSPPEAVRVVLR
jgi:hypothetical protein